MMTTAQEALEEMVHIAVRHLNATITAAKGAGVRTELSSVTETGVPSIRGNAVAASTSEADDDYDEPITPARPWEYDDVIAAFTAGVDFQIDFAERLKRDADDADTRDAARDWADRATERDGAGMQPLQHVGLHTHRLQHSTLEAAFAEEWRKVNDPNPGISRYLESLMRVGNGTQFGGFEDRPLAFTTITQRDATIAATIIQWLGTNVGRSFLAEVARRAEHDFYLEIRRAK